MITNGAANFDIELRRNAVYTLSYDMLEDGVVVPLSGMTHTLVIRTVAKDEEVLSKEATPDVDNQIVFEISKTEIGSLPTGTRLDYYIVETPGDQMISYGNVSIVK